MTLVLISSCLPLEEVGGASVHNPAGPAALGAEWVDHYRRMGAGVEHLVGLLFRGFVVRSAACSILRRFR